MYRLLILLNYYKHYQSAVSLALMIRFPMSTVHETIQATAAAIAPLLKEKYVSLPQPPQLDLGLENKDLEFPSSVCVVDSTFLPSHAPLSAFPAGKEWYSVKHRNTPHSLWPFYSGLSVLPCRHTRH